MHENTTQQSAELEILKQNYQQFLEKAKKLKEEKDNLEAEKQKLKEEKENLIQELKEAYQKIEALANADLTLQEVQQKEQSVTKKNEKLELLRLELLKHSERQKNREENLKSREQLLQEQEQKLETTITAAKIKANEEAQKSIAEQIKDLDQRQARLKEEECKFQADKRKYEKDTDLKYRNENIERYNSEISKFYYEFIAVGVLLMTTLVSETLMNVSVLHNIGQDISAVWGIGDGIWGTIKGGIVFILSLAGFIGVFYTKNEAPAIIGGVLRLAFIIFVLNFSGRIGIDTAASVIEVFALICVSVRWLLR